MGTCSLISEHLLSLVEAARLLPPCRASRAVHPSTLLRWILRGCRGVSGQRVHLEAVRLGGRWVTSRQALERFTSELSQRHITERPEFRSSTERRRANDRAARELAKRGI